MNVEPIFETIYNGLLFRIEEFSPDFGFDLFVYENGKCIYDSFQDTVDICKSVALEEFGVPLDSWEQVEK